MGSAYQAHAERRRRQLLRGLIVTAAAIAASSTLYNLTFTGFLGVATYQAASLAILLYLFRRLQHGADTQVIARTVFALLSVGTFGLVLATEGRNLNFIWLLAMPLMAHFLFGKRAGIALSITLGLAAAAVLLHGLAQWPPPRFTSVAVVNLLGAWFGVSLLSVYFELTRSETEAAVMELALTDPLTGIWNRRYFTERAEQEIGRSQRYGLVVSLIVLDLDRFKLVNDTYGHGKGDEVIRRLTEILQARVRGADVVARLGGEEFGILLPHTGRFQARQLAETLRRAVEACLACDEGLETDCTISLGVAAWRAGMTFAELFRAADEALYRAKQSGRNCIRSADGSAQEPTRVEQQRPQTG